MSVTTAATQHSVSPLTQTQHRLYLEIVVCCIESKYNVTSTYSEEEGTWNVTTKAPEWGAAPPLILPSFEQTNQLKIHRNKSAPRKERITRNSKRSMLTHRTNNRDSSHFQRAQSATDRYVACTKH
jgi:hypothetical protein